MDPSEALADCAFRLDVDGMRRAIARGADLKVAEAISLQPICASVATARSWGAERASRQLAALQLLQWHGAKSPEDAGFSLTRAVHYMSDVRVIYFLLAAGGDARHANTISGYTPLHFVASAEVARVLLAAGARVTAERPVPAAAHR